MRRLLLPALLLLASVASFADENPPRLDRDREAPRHHFILTAEHTLRMDEEAKLGAAGVEIQQVLPNQRYIVRMVRAEDLADDPRVASVELIAPSRKIDRSAFREAARARAFARVRLVFHADVSFSEAQAAVQHVGGSVDQVLSDDFVLPQRLLAHIPFAALSSLAADDRVFAVYGPSLKIGPLNAVAAQLSHVTPLFAAPYNLSGSGVVLSEFEFGEAYAAHPEFGGRLMTHVSGGEAGNQLHATHVAGTMIAAGVEPRAKGMAPNATLHEFDVRADFPIVLNNKQTQLPPLGVVADNNSWGFQLGWQFDSSSANSTAWFGGEEFFGGYDAFYSAPYDKIGRTSTVLFVHSAGNDGDAGSSPPLTPPFYAHGHADDNGDLIKGETFCYSKDGTGTDCQLPCSAGPTHCEIKKHPTYGPYTTVGPTGSLKNVISVGAVDSGGLIAGFSSRGPTHDGRVKPDVVAKGVHQFSTGTGGGYVVENGTSMSSPVVTGISALLTEQWRKSFAGQNPLPIALKTVLIAGADDLGPPGPDYTYGFGLVNAQASADLIIADSNTGSRIRLGTVSQGQQVEFPLTLTAAQKLRIVVGWADPEVLLGPDELAEKTLINDLDVKIIDPSGTPVLPYVLDRNNASNGASRGINSADNVEEVEIANAPAGTYRVLLTGTTIGIGPTQQYALVANAPLGGAILVCDDPFEPNDTEATAFGYLVNRQPIAASICPATDVDFYRIRTTVAGPLTIAVTTTDTALRVTLYGNGITPIVSDIAARTTGSVSAQTGSVPAVYIVKVEPIGVVGAIRGYTLTPTFATALVPRRRSTRH